MGLGGILVDALDKVCHVEVPMRNAADLELQGLPELGQEWADGVSCLLAQDERAGQERPDVPKRPWLLSAIAVRLQPRRLASGQWRSITREPLVRGKVVRARLTIGNRVVRKNGRVLQFLTTCIREKLACPGMQRPTTLVPNIGLLGFENLGICNGVSVDTLWSTSGTRSDFLDVRHCLLERIDVRVEPFL